MWSVSQTKSEGPGLFSSAKDSDDLMKRLDEKREERRAEEKRLEKKRKAEAEKAKQAAQDSLDVKASVEVETDAGASRTQPASGNVDFTA